MAARFPSAWLMTMHSLGNLVRTNMDRVTGCACIGAGAVALALGWRGTAWAGDTADQASFIVSGGLLGMLLLGVGVTLWLTADLDDLARQAGNSTGFAGRRLVHGAWAGAAFLLVLGWFQASNADDGAGAWPGALMAVGGLVAAGVVTVVTLAAWSRTTRPETVPTVGRAPGGDGDERPAVLLVAVGLTRYHRPGCRTLAELQTQPVPPDQLDPSLRACQICQAPALASWRPS